MTEPKQSAKKTPAPKGVPTPSRAEREAANKRPIVIGDKKEAKRQARQKLQAERLKAREGLARGDERYLTARDKGPQRKYARSYVDARPGIGQYMLPLMIIVLFSSFIGDFQLQLTLAYVLYAIVALVVLDSFVLSAQLNRRLRGKFGSTERGVRWYAVMRSTQMRMMRLPKPTNKLFEWPS